MKEYIFKSTEILDKDNDIELLRDLKKIFASSNINFLLGSGFSAGILSPLGNIEIFIEKIRNNKEEIEQIRILESCVFWLFFQESIYPISRLYKNKSLIKDHSNFFDELNSLIFTRGNTIKNKRINIFTTNYDPIIEMTLENKQIIYNDGFTGRIFSVFNTSNFNRNYYSQLIFSDNLVEIPVFNIIKLHGSTTWENKTKENEIIYHNIENKLNRFYEKYNSKFSKYSDYLEDIKSINSNILQELKNVNQKILSKEQDLERIENFSIEFLKDYKEKFEIINPTKEKFRETTFNKTYHELLRIYSNELEKQNTVLFVFGFSFKDEHILEITKRSLGNPTLKIIIFAYEKKELENYKEKLGKFNNVSVVALEKETEESGKLDLNFLTKIFTLINKLWGRYYEKYSFKDRYCCWSKR